MGGFIDVDVALDVHAVSATKARRTFQAYARNSTPRWQFAARDAADST